MNADETVSDRIEKRCPKWYMLKEWRRINFPKEYSNELQSKIGGVAGQERPGMRISRK